MNPIDHAQAISRDNIPRVDYHMHTTWTDGNNTALEMHSKAIEIGLKHILFSEHARKSSGDWFFKFAAEIRVLPQSTCQALVGVETKVADYAGNIDATDEMLEACDLVMASVHRFPGEQGAVKGFADINPDDAISIELELSLAVLDNKSVDILGHPFGMSLNRFKRQPDAKQFKQIINKAAKTGVAFEINSRYHLDPWLLIEMCQSAGAKISLGSNAHEIATVGDINRMLSKKDSE